MLLAISWHPPNFHRGAANGDYTFAPADAPALMQTHIRIAIGAGTNIAIEWSDVILIEERLAAMPETIAVGAASYLTTVQSLWLALFSTLAFSSTASA